MKDSPETVPEHTVGCYCHWSLPFINFSVSFDQQCNVKWFVIQNKISDGSFLSIRVDIDTSKCTVQSHGTRSGDSSTIVLEESYIAPHLTIKEAMVKLLKYKKLMVFA